MRTVADPEVVLSLKARLEMLRPDSARRWGTMTPQEMLCHLGDAAAMVLLTRPRPAPIPSRTRPIVKAVVLWAPLPWPRGFPTSPMLNPKADGTQPSEFATGSEPTLAGSGPGDPGTGDLLARSQAAFEGIVPGVWRDALPVQLSIINGGTSLSWTDGRLEVGSVHASGDWARLEAVMGHEFGHHVSFRYGSQAELGAAPAGWPPSSGVPAEAWADCVSSSYIPYYPCDGSSHAWTSDWMAAGPAAHPPTG